MNQPTTPSPRNHFNPAPWVLVWAVYVLLALGWFGYQDTLAGYLCLAPR